MHTHLLVAVLGLCFLSAGSGARQQPPSIASGSIAGTLTSSDLGKPIRKATVTLTNVSTRAGRTTITDAEGGYLFDAVPPGEYTMSAAKPGYLQMTLGARRPGPGVPGTILTLAAGQTLDKVAMSLPRGSVISGTVTDEFGDPAMSVWVRALRFSYVNGHRTAVPADSAITDDLGGYRIPGLMPGEYIVGALPRDTVANVSANDDADRTRLEQVRGAGTRNEQRATGPQPPVKPDGYVPSYFGGTPAAAAASRVRLSLGEQASSVDIQLTAMLTGTVSGVVTTSDGAPRAGTVHLVDPVMPIAGLAGWFRNPGPDGRFSFAGLIPGTYVLRARGTKTAGSAGDGALTSIVTVQVPHGGQVDASVTLTRGVAVSGVLDTTALPSTADRARLRVQLDPILGPSGWEYPLTRAAVDTDGRFAIGPLAAGPYRLSVSGLPPGWLLESASFGTIDAADVDLNVESENISGGVVRLTARPSELSGAVTNAENEPVGTHSIVLFPADRDFWLPQSRRIQLAQPGPDGRYVFRGLPAGDYRIAAVDPPEPGEQFTADYLARILPAATLITLAPGAKITQDLRVR